MTAIDSEASNYRSPTFYAKCAGLAFFIYLFFMFFGTSMPFPDLTPEVAQTSKSNPVNQLLSLLFVVCIFSLIGKHNEILTFILKEKYLTLFMAWAFLSVTWSDHSMISLKRCISLLGEIIICLAALLHFKWSEVALKPMRAIMSVYLPLTILSVIFVPEAIQWEFPAWRGLADTKNNLGQVTLFCTIIWLVIIQMNRNRPVNAVHFVMLAMAVVALLGAQSTTAFLISGLLLSIQGVLSFGKLLKRGEVARLYTFFVVSSGLFIASLIVFVTPEILEALVGVFGKDLTFSGRVDLWQAILNMTQDKIITGWGLGGFWVEGSSHLLPIFEQFVWVPNQAHQGYIDIINQVGVVGFGLLALMIFSYFRRLSQLKKGQFWKWLFLSILILNFQESVFFRPRHIGHFMFIFTYVALHTDLLKEKMGLNEYAGVLATPIGIPNLGGAGKKAHGGAAI